MKKIGINACTGRMGQELLFAADRDNSVELSAAFLRQGHKWTGLPVSGQYHDIKSGLNFVDSLEDAGSKIDVLIDFSLPDYSIETVRRCSALKIPVVIGTTGFSYQQKKELEKASDSIPILMSPNMSIGVNLTLNILETVARIIGDESDIEIIESHHRYKKDAPSGTALRMGEAIASGLDKVFSEIAAFDRCGKDAVRKQGSIGFSAIRAGNIIGEHTALFAMSGEEIEVTHKARNRQTFAQGAIRAAKWLIDQPCGQYDMLDMLNLRD